ncbi:MAG TPA: metallophosphoesterase family protein [Candidatus Omnitrophota bacterium]|nr:metallophosphoesterase family protein [Candidatus Omnitrophota bacterium]
MKIGIVSDTHSLELPLQMIKDFSTLDLIVHAGDFCSWEDVEKFKKMKDLRAVYGNMDVSRIRRSFPRTQIFKFGSFKVGLFHGDGPASIALENVKAEFAKEKTDCIVFGHSHQPFNQTIGQVLFFNPGSPNDTIRAPYRSYGILEIVDQKIVGKIIKVK